MYKIFLYDNVLSFISQYKLRQYLMTHTDNEYFINNIINISHTAVSGFDMRNLGFGLLIYINSPNLMKCISAYNGPLGKKAKEYFHREYYINKILNV